ncbi:MAG: amidohydrolase family protein [Deltaproteobacteria bacterium]|nr:amidohydrolase family protein [Deltaproteobacteria bacterium]MBI3386702.1 amidohydrolase family protein [Deltaproteobacteria bacterium]
MHIDAHQHFWQYRRATHGWITDAMAPLKRDFLPEHLAPLLAAADFDGCVAVQAQQDVAETEWLLQLADAHPFIRGVVGWVDLCAPTVTDALHRCAAHSKLRGVRHVVQDEPDDQFVLRADFQRGIAALASFGLTYDVLVYARQLPAAIELVRRFPQQRFVLDHIGKPEIGARRIDDWRRDIVALAASGDVYCKLSGMVTETDWHSWKPAHFTVYLDAALEAFGPQRLLIGSDWPVCLLAGTYADVVAIVTDYIARLAPGEQRAILGETAVHCYGLA